MVIKKVTRGRGEMVPACLPDRWMLGFRVYGLGFPRGFQARAQQLRAYASLPEKSPASVRLCFRTKLLIKP